nr:Gag-Pol polyprotein [Tanacetum cinerariifolium]
GDRVLRINSRGKKLEVEEHRSNVKLPKNKMSVTACNDSLNNKTVNVKSVSMCDKCVMIEKHDLCVPKSVAKPIKKIVASESNKKPRNNVRKIHERFGKIYKLSYIKFTPSGYMWKPKSPTGNVNPNLIEIVLFIVDSGCSKHMTASVQVSSDLAPECQTMALEHDSLSPRRKCEENVSHGDKTGTMSNELDLLFSLMFDELLNGSSKVVSKYFAVSAADAPYQQPHAKNDEVVEDEFINIFSTPVQDQGETSSRHVDSSNMHTFYQRYPSEQRWTKDHPLEQVIGNPSQSVRTRRQLESDAEMCMFALIVSRNAPKIIKEAMADSAWIESIQEELHQFDRLDVWELVDRPLCKN